MIVQFFVNDFFDVWRSNESFHHSIGFDLPLQNGLLSYLKLSHLRRFVVNEIGKPLYGYLKDKRNHVGYDLGNFKAFERDRREVHKGYEKVHHYVAQMKATADRHGIALVAVMVPASVQVCRPSELDYFPRGVHLSDTRRFDIDQPQRLLARIFDDLSVSFYDLRPVLVNLATCPYQAKNMHWNQTGHAVVARFVADALLRDGFIRRKPGKSSEERVEFLSPRTARGSK
jgi:hypothetical protein